MTGWILYIDRVKNSPHVNYSVRRMVESAQDNGVNLRVIHPDQLELVVGGPGAAVLVDGKPEALPDFVMPRLGSRTSPFGMAAIRHFEGLGVCCVNGSAGVAVAKDKMATMQVLAAAGIAVPRSLLLKFPADAELVERAIGFPAVVKLLSGSQGSGVLLAKEKKEFADIMGLVEGVRPGANLLAQQFVASSSGTDLRVMVVGRKAVAAARRSSSSSFKANLSQGEGGQVEAYPLDPALEELALRITRAVGLEVAGIDLLFGPEGFLVCEVNSSPGFRVIELSAGLDLPQILFDHIRQSLGPAHKTGAEHA